LRIPFDGLTTRLSGYSNWLPNLPLYYLTANVSEFPLSQSRRPLSEHFAPEFTSG
jgi:hypothetical protein